MSESPTRRHDPARQDAGPRQLQRRQHDRVDDLRRILGRENQRPQGWSFSRRQSTTKNTNFGDVDFSADVKIPSANGGDAGLVFRAAKPALGTDAYDGYYAGIGTSGKLVLGKAKGGLWTQLASVKADIVPGKTYRVRVTAKKNAISVYAGESTTAQLHVLEGTFASGMNGARVFQTDAVFDNIKVEHL
ncbi:hypothetical protein J3458_020901 [Metarhizium acridum]|uniref:uncharacterized protein n=1 Tax=Metarhizium acridum TaxID=92637 RepID=UPI001C6B401A|nr:hypothetical protein J3458_020901 [Metarhizium acridum]